MNTRITAKLERLLEYRQQLVDRGTVRGSLTEINGSWMLRWTENGRLAGKAIPRQEKDVYLAKIDRYRKVEAIDRALAKIDKILVGAMENFGIADADDEEMAA